MLHPDDASTAALKTTFFTLVDPAKHCDVPIIYVWLGLLNVWVAPRSFHTHSPEWPMKSTFSTNLAVLAETRFKWDMLHYTTSTSTIAKYSARGNKDGRWRQPNTYVGGRWDTLWMCGGAVISPNIAHHASNTDQEMATGNQCTHLSLTSYALLFLRCGYAICLHVADSGNAPKQQSQT